MLRYKSADDLFQLHVYKKGGSGPPEPPPPLDLPLLTSEECLKILKEKERKREEAENREKFRQENLEKKRLRDEERKRKSEKLARKRADREAAKAVKEAEKEAIKAAKEAQKAAKKAEKVSKLVLQATSKQTKGTKRKAEGECINTNRKKNHLDSIVFSDLCCVCFGSYDEDAGNGRQWLQCKCLRWIHEDCVDYEDSSPDSGLCPLC